MKTPASKLHEDLMNKLVILHIYKQEHEDDPVAGLHALLNMEQEIALDPAVSEKAAALVQSGREQADKDQYTQGYQDGLKNRASAVNLSILLDKVDALHDHMFSICCSNPIYNAWGQPVDVSLLNDIHEFSRSIRPRMERPDLTAPAHFYKVRKKNTELVAENDALKARIEVLERLLNTPRTDDWFEGVRLEAGHQIRRWGSDHDAGKSPADWFWLIGYLAQKAMNAQMVGDEMKARHHTISTGAAMLNWFRAITGESTTMRPGIDGRSGV